MSLTSTIAELREWADDERRSSWSGPTDPDEFLDAVADELAEYAADVRLVVVGGARDQPALDAAAARLRAALE